MKKASQTEVARQLGISKSYLSLLISGQRRVPEHLEEAVNSLQNQLREVPSKQRVVGSNPSRDAIQPLLGLGAPTSLAEESSFPLHLARLITAGDLHWSAA